MKYLITFLFAVTLAHAQYMDLTWKDNATNEDGFRVERSTNGTNFVQIADLPTPNLQAWRDNSVVFNVRYWYRVRAFNVTGNSGYSNTADSLVPAPGSLPADPGGTVAIPGTEPPPPALVSVLKESNEDNLTSYNYVGQGVNRRVSWTRVIPTSSFYLDTVEFVAMEAAGDTALAAFVVIFTGDLDHPITQVGGASSQVPAANFTGTATWQTAVFTTRPPIVSGQPYWQGVVAVGPDSPDFIQHRRNGVSGRTGHSTWPYGGTIGETSNGRSGSYRWYALETP